MSNSHGRFVWYELMTTDVEAAKAFYVRVAGWDTRDASMPGLRYTLLQLAKLQPADWLAYLRMRKNWAQRRVGSDMSASTMWSLPPVG